MSLRSVLYSKLTVTVGALGTLGGLAALSAFAEAYGQAAAELDRRRMEHELCDVAISAN
jgi:hypothetical protein